MIESMNNKVNVFGIEMVNVLEDIKSAARDHVFKKEPKGPIGKKSEIFIKSNRTIFVIPLCAYDCNKKCVFGKK